MGDFPAIPAIPVYFFGGGWEELCAYMDKLIQHYLGEVTGFMRGWGREVLW